MGKFKPQPSFFGACFLVAIMCLVVTPASESQLMTIDPALVEAKEYAKAEDVESIVVLAASNPDLAVEISQIAVEINPGMAIDIACRLADVIPNLAIDVAVSIVEKMPENAMDIASCIAGALPPENAPSVAAAIANAIPHDYAADIAGAVAGAVPDWAGETTIRVVEVAPEYEENIKERVADAIAFEEEVTEDRVPPLAPPAPPYGQ